MFSLLRSNESGIYELAYTITDENGIMPLLSNVEAELQNGWTMTYSNADGTVRQFCSCADGLHGP